ncbi:MAG: M48 family metallopeptidase [Oscillospiraceae bacterium]|nr:M48 family metallopeptidase [Oscillospiraceae bacterium]
MHCNNIDSEIEVRFSRRKTLCAEITPQGQLIVRAPIGTSNSTIREFLNRYAERIQADLDRCRQKAKSSAQLPPISYEEIEELCKKACEVIPPRVKYYADKIGVTYGNITIRNQKTRWGSCSGKGNLNFNCLLMLAPEEVLDSVIIHELCHRIHPNHSKNFYELVYRHCPNYDQYDKWLKEEGGKLILRMLSN